MTDRQQQQHHHHHGTRGTDSIDTVDRVPSSVHTSRSHSTSSSTAATAASTVSTPSAQREDHYHYHQSESLDFSTREEVVAAFASGQRRLQLQMTERQRRMTVAQAAAERDAHLHILEGSFGKRFLKKALKLVEDYNEYDGEEAVVAAAAKAAAGKDEEERSSSISDETDHLKQTKLLSLRPVIAIYAKAWFPRQIESLKSPAGRGHDGINSGGDQTQISPHAPSSASIAAAVDTRPSARSSFELPFNLGPHTTAEYLEIVEFEII